MLSTKLAIERDGLQRIIDSLARRGYRVIGPTVRDGAIVYDTVVRLDELPVGWTDQQDGGRYRLERRSDEALFGYAVGPHPWKHFLHPPVQRLWQARREGDGFAVIEDETVSERLPLLECARVSCVRSRSRTGSFSRGRSSTIPTKFGATMPSSLPIALRRAPRAFASRWMPDRKLRPVSTSL
jgi:hypothetical protein